MISYIEGYKYQLAEEYKILTPVQGEDTDIDYIRLGPSGMLVIRKGYAWDGPSGPTFDTKTFMRASLVHDAFYQLMRQGFIDKGEWRKTVDKLMQTMNIEDGMCKLRAWWVYKSLRIAAGKAASASSRRKIIMAP